MRNENKSFNEMTTGERIRSIRKKKGISQETLAEAVFTKKQTISLYEQDKLELKVSMLKRIAKVLGVPVADLIEEDETTEKMDMIHMTYDITEASAILRSMSPAYRKAAIAQLRALLALEAHER